MRVLISHTAGYFRNIISYVFKQFDGLVHADLKKIFPEIHTGFPFKVNSKICRRKVDLFGHILKTYIFIEVRFDIFLGDRHLNKIIVIGAII